jgi:hypothetical protein
MRHHFVMIALTLMLVAIYWQSIAQLLCEFLIDFFSVLIFGSSPLTFYIAAL